METIALTGEIDPLAALELRARLTQATAELRPVVEVDLTGVTSIHVAGVAALIGAARRAQRRRGELRLRPPSSDRARGELAMASWFPVVDLDPALK